MPNTRSGALRTRERINEQIDRRLAVVLGARDAARNLEPFIGGGGEQEEISGNGVNGNGVNGNGGNGNGGNGNGGNGNGGNGNGGVNGNGNGNEGGNGYNPGGVKIGWTRPSSKTDELGGVPRFKRPSRGGFHTCNHPEDDFTPLETIRRPYSVIRKRIPFELEGETFEPEGGGAYGGEPSVDLLRSFLNLGRAGDWLTLSNRGGVDVPKALIKPVTRLENWKEMYFRSFMIQGVDGEFNFLPEGGFDDNQGSLSAKSENNETPIIDAEPISTVLPSNVADNIIDSSNTSSDDELPPVHPSTSSFPEVGEKSKAAGKRKLAADALREGTNTTQIKSSKALPKLKMSSEFTRS
ncbi:hypothetical protein Tco_1301411 [Tanacetum coccineum]